MRRKSRTKPTETRWLWAGVIALVLHLCALLGAGRLELFAQEPDAPHPPDLLEVVFEPPDRAVPTRFTELPDDREDEVDPNASLLSNVDSRSRDRRQADAKTELPHMEGRAESPQVRRIQGDATRTPVPSPEEGKRPPAERIEDVVKELPEEAVSDPAGSRSLDRLRVERSSGLFAERQRSVRPHSAQPGPRQVPTPAPPGDSDLTEEEMRNPAGQAGLSGDISLSTTEWEFADWMERFRRNFYEHWVPPRGFQIGLIRGGWTMVELEIDPSGQLLRFDVLGEAGHPALKRSSMRAVEYSAPYEPLPEDFPDPTLLLRIRLIYHDRRQ